MSRLRSCLLVFQLALAAVPAAAQQPPRRDPQAEAVLRSSLAAMGAGQLAQLRRDQTTILATGTYATSGSPLGTSYAFRLKALGLDQLRWETDRPEGIVVTLIRNGAGWSLSPRGTRGLTVGAISGKQFELFPLLAMAEWLSHPNAKLRHGGIEMESGKSLVRLTLNRGRAGDPPFQEETPFEKMSLSELYLDSTTLLPARLRYYEHPGDWRVNIPIDVVFSNYQRVGGLLIPMTVTRLLRGQALDEYQFQSVNLNASLDPSEFALRKP